MKPAKFDYESAATVDEAVKLLGGSHGFAKVLAGGQSLGPMMNLRLAQPDLLIDVRRIEELGSVEQRDGGLFIGAGVIHSTIEDGALPDATNGFLPFVAGQIAYRAVRNRGSVGGNLCHADPSSENPAVAVASGATLVLKSADGERRVAAEDFFLGLYETAAQQNELLTEIRIPKAPAHQGWSFQETSTRKGDFALVGIAATLDCPNGTCTNARIVAVGVGERAMRLDAAEVAITGAVMDDTDLTAAAEAARDSVDPPSDFHADSEFRRDLVFSLTKRALSEAHGRCGKEG